MLRISNPPVISRYVRLPPVGYANDLGLWIVDSIRVGNWGLDRIMNNISIDDRQKLK
jgi:hypothetical protein